MKIIPVLDIKDNKIVHAISGKRKEYEPIQSTICDTADPLDVATSIKEKLNLSTIYIADLDSIEKKGSNFNSIKKIMDSGIELYLDAGILDYESYLKAKSYCNRAIVATETLEKLEDLKKITENDKNVILSIDMFRGKVISRITTSIDAILEFASSYGIKTLILLDLYYVGTGKMRASPQLKDILKKKEFEVITGGGIKTIEDMIKLKKMGLFGALVATAIHNGTIQKRDIEDISTDL